MGAFVIIIMYQVALILYWVAVTLGGKWQALVDFLQTQNLGSRSHCSVEPLSLLIHN